MSNSTNESSTVINLHPEHTLPRRHGILLVLSGPSGAGKTTLAHGLLDRHGGPGGNLTRSVSVTTRPRRTTEVDGEDYSFVSDDGFAAMQQKGELLECTELYGYRYGTPRSPVERCLEEGRDVLLVLDSQGRRQIANCRIAELVSIFVLPPSLKELRNRLRGRQEDEETVSRRLAEACDEIACCTEYDHVLRNENLDATLNDLDSILRAERRQRERSTLSFTSTIAETWHGTPDAPLRLLPA